ncbi:MAG TPA: DUF669 domain-containing protein [Thermodesulfovibrionia bacterium]|nr:DUF669 domain-containing protein [Thermodesulfovibrionia bacterium]
MVFVDFPNIPDNENVELVPAGSYIVKVVDVKECVAKSTGNKFWVFVFEIVDGNYKGTILKDTLFFTERAFPRVKLVCSRLGLPVDNAVDLMPSMLIGKGCILTVKVEQARDADGLPKRNREGNEYDINIVPFAGYARCENIEEDVPF